MGITSEDESEERVQRLCALCLVPLEPPLVLSELADVALYAS